MNLSTKEIMETVKNTPVFHKEEIEASYIGRNITWELCFRAIDKPKEGLSKISSVDPQGYPWVFFKIPLDKYPEFKLLNENRLISVTGTIANVTGHCIYLEDIASLEVLELIKNKTWKTEISVPEVKSYKKDNSNQSIFKTILLHPIYSLLILGFILFVIYKLTGINLKDYLI